jgi:hypothetical protein
LIVLIVSLLLALLLVVVGPRPCGYGLRRRRLRRSSGAQAAVRALPPLGEGARRPELYVGLGEAWTVVGSGLSRPHRPQFTTENKDTRLGGVLGRKYAKKVPKDHSLVGCADFLVPARMRVSLIGRIAKGKRAHAGHNSPAVQHGIHYGAILSLPMVLAFVGAAYLQSSAPLAHLLHLAAHMCHRRNASVQSLADPLVGPGGRTVAIDLKRDAGKSDLPERCKRWRRRMSSTSPSDAAWTRSITSSKPSLPPW